MTPARIRVLCDPEDQDALWLAHCLTRSGEDARCVHPGELVHGSALSYRFDTDVTASTLRTRDGQDLDGGHLDLVINRIWELPPGALGTTATDELYMAEERRAAIAAWLRMLPCPVLNPPRASTLGGPVFRTPVWRAIARRHGLPIRPWHSVAEDLSARQFFRSVVVGERFIDPSGDLPDVHAAAVVAMAGHVGTPLLGATFVLDDDWQFIDATPQPSLVSGGQALVDAVAHCARRGAEATA